MDNDNKVMPPDNNRHNEVLLFLNQELSKLQEHNENVSYNLEKEFAKTKNHKNKSVIIILIVSFVAVFALAAVISVSLTKSNNNLTVSMNSFDDLNLRSLIDSVSSAQNNYDNAVKTKIRLEVELESVLKEAENQKENDIFVLDSMKLKSKSEYKNRLNKIEETYKEAVSKAHQDYDTEIAATQKEVELYQEQLQQFDAAKVQAAQDQKKALDSERELRLLEQKKITDKYDAQIAQLQNKITELSRKNKSDMHSALGEMTNRYEDELRTLDPVLFDVQASEIITNVKESQPVFNAEQYAAENNLNNESVNNAFIEYEKIKEDYNYLENAVKKVPYKNSVPEYLAASRQLVDKMGETMASGSMELYKQNQQLENANKKLKTEVENQKKQVEQVKKLREEDKQHVEAVFETMLNTVKAQGVILSASSADNIRVYIGLKYRELIEAEGLPAEVKGVKSVKGRVIQAEDKSFVFEPGLDKNGVPVEVDISAIPPGSIIKITVK